MADPPASEPTEAPAPEAVVADPERLGGTWVVRGTRIPVALLVAQGRQGAGVDEILRECPALTPELLAGALLWALAHPDQLAPPPRLPFTVLGTTGSQP